MTSLNEKNISAQSRLWKSAIQRPVNLLFYMGLLVIIVAVFIPLSNIFSVGDMVFGVILLGFAYWGQKHGQMTDGDDVTQASVYLWQIFIALLGLVSCLGIYITVAVVFEYDFHTILSYVLNHFALLVIAYMIGYYRSYSRHPAN